MNKNNNFYLSEDDGRTLVFWFGSYYRTKNNVKSTFDPKPLYRFDKKETFINILAIICMVLFFYFVSLDKWEWIYILIFIVFSGAFFDLRKRERRLKEFVNEHFPNLDRLTETPESAREASKMVNAAWTDVRVEICISIVGFIATYFGAGWILEWKGFDSQTALYLSIVTAVSVVIYSNIRHLVNYKIRKKFKEKYNQELTIEALREVKSIITF